MRAQDILPVEWLAMSEALRLAPLAQAILPVEWLAMSKALRLAPLAQGILLVEWLAMSEAHASPKASVSRVEWWRRRELNPRPRTRRRRSLRACLHSRVAAG